MRMTAFTDYGLRVLIYLAVHEGERVTVAMIRDAFDVSESHLVKVVHFLGKAGYVTTVRGRGGGLRLALPPQRINLGAVVRATEPDPMPAECFDPSTSACRIVPVCRLRAVLGEAVDGFHAVLDRHTLADLVANRPALVRRLADMTLQARPQPAA